MNPLRALVPVSVRHHIHVARYLVAIWRKSYGVAPRECSACGYRGYFQAAGNPPRYDARCPKCGSFERHRLMALALHREHLVVRGDRVVHFAPEPVVADLVRKIGVDYRSADIEPGRGDLVVDIEKITIPPGSVDVFVASHVLEHVDDRKALGELHRVLAPGGRLIVAVPIIEGWDRSYEPLGVTSPEERELHFGQDDHVRFYGRDIRDRMKVAGFTLSEFVGSGAEAVRYSLQRGERIFIGKKSEQS